MLKKNQLALILLTLVLMLTVYYITSPFDNKNNNNNNDDDDITDTTGRLEELAAMRQTIREERSLAVMALDAIIADSTKSIVEKTAALDEKRYINSLTEKELLLELEVISMGYRDAFVHASSTGVEVTVIAEEHSLSKANEIVVKTMLQFDQPYDNVVLKFSTAEQVMGEVG